MNKIISNFFKGDKGIWMVFFFLCIISVVEVFSASSHLTYKTHDYVGPIVYHAGTIVAGLFVALVTLHIPCRYFKLMTPFLLMISWGTLVWVLVGGETINGANRVIAIFGTTFQPSEIAKGTIVLATAQILSAMQRENGADKTAFYGIMIIAGFTCILIGLENLSTAILLFSVVFMMMVIGSVPARQLLWIVGIGAIVVTFVLAFVMIIGNTDEIEKDKTEKAELVQEAPKKKSAFEKMLHRADTWKGRIVNFGKGDVAPEKFDLDKDAQVGHACIAIASSGIIGVGPGKSTERDFLPQAYSDFIFAIIIEELGIGGAIFVVLLYITLLYRGARIANRCVNYFPAFLVMGLSLLLVVQACFNMMVAVGLAPVTGQPLPLISKGGTSTIINCAYIGAILSVSRSAKTKKGSTRKKKVQENSSVTK